MSQFVTTTTLRPEEPRRVLVGVKNEPREDLSLFFDLGQHLCKKFLGRELRLLPCVEGYDRCQFYCDSAEDAQEMRWLVYDFNVTEPLIKHQVYYLPHLVYLLRIEENGQWYGTDHSKSESCLPSTRTFVDQTQAWSSASKVMADRYSWGNKRDWKEALRREGGQEAANDFGASTESLVSTGSPAYSYGRGSSVGR